ncbi:ABC transporter ATP-binding protein [Microbacterium gilvum]|uniref:ABC transporter ATP-binding protein n=1 Tax=Microbacterium gilvum TaxID=1336204 RepID=A0ABP9A9Y1_9MICO
MTADLQTPALIDRAADGAVPADALVVRDLVIDLIARRGPVPGATTGAPVTGDPAPGGGRPLVSVDNLVVPAGTSVGLVGESGSGKTLTALAVAGLLPWGIATYGGEVEVAGAEVRALRPAASRAHRSAHIGVVFQNPTSALNPRLRIATQLAEALPRDVPRAQRRADAAELLRLVGIADAEKTLGSFPHELSGGLNQRVVIAMALARRPSLLIADEPTTALDVSVQAQVLDLLDDLRRRLGIGILLVSHDIGVIADRTEHVYVMADGAVVEHGPTERVLGAPEHPYTQTLLAAVPSRLAPSRPASSRDRAAAADAAEAPLVELVDLHRSFTVRAPDGRRRHVALDGVSLDVQRGQSLGIVGESGSGKTTLARIVVGLDAPDSGGVRFDGVEPRRLRGAARQRWRRDVQYVFQDPYASLDPRLTVAQTLREPLELQRLGLDRRAVSARIDELLDDVELPRGFRDRLPAELSGGQRQRVGIARALASEPRLIVADEPVSALDLSVQARILRLLERLRAEHDLTYLFISHDLGVVRFLCEDVVVLRHGRIVEQGPTDDVLSRPQHPYTRALVDAIPGRAFA